jgi:hypothetical protein
MLLFSRLFPIPSSIRAVILFEFIGELHIYIGKTIAIERGRRRNTTESDTKPGFFILLFSLKDIVGGRYEDIHEPPCSMKPSGYLVPDFQDMAGEALESHPCPLQTTTSR